MGICQAKGVACLCLLRLFGEDLHPLRILDCSCVFYIVRFSDYRYVAVAQ